jgi:aspartate aminotransferase-like enzyme
MTREKLLLIPGPSPVVPRILDALAVPTVSHVGPEMVRDLRDACEDLKKVVFCPAGEALIVSGAGTLSMEIALLNTVDIRKDRVLILSQGYFGRRMVEICEAFGIRHDALEAEWGKAVLPEELEAQLKTAAYDVVVCTHVDTATGACAPVEAYARAANAAEALFIVDGVCATGGIPERMDDWRIDVVLTAAQKCFGAPPGLAIAVFSERAMARRQGLGSIPAYYADILRWLPIMKDPAKYFSTPCVNEIRAFREALRLVLEEGVEQRFRRHEATGRAMRAALSVLGFTFFTDSRFLAPTLSVAQYPAGVEDKPFRQTLAENGVIVAGGLAHTMGKVFRMGHMGNLSTDDIRFTCEALETTLRSLKDRFEPGAAWNAARPHLG